MYKTWLLAPIFLMLLALVTSTVVTAVDPESAATITKNDNTAKRLVINSLDKAVNNSYADIKKITIELFDNTSQVIYDRNCPVGQNLINGTCTVPNPPSVVIPPPTSNETQPATNTTSNATKTTLVFAGDVDGTSVRDAIKDANPDLVVVSGDLGYDSTLSAFKKDYVNVFGSKLKCNIGNHDAPEDGSASIYTEAKKLCGELWFEEVANNTTLIIGFNSNGNLDTLLGQAQTYVSNSANMQGIKNVFITSHKPAHAAPNSHHPVSEDPEVKTFVDSLKSKISSNEIEINAHNHVNAKASGKYYTSGAGGKSHYECGKDATWTFCNNADGYLKFEIDSAGKILSDKFYSSNGGVLG